MTTQVQKPPPQRPWGLTRGAKSSEGQRPPRLSLKMSLKTCKISLEHVLLHR